MKMFMYALMFAVAFLLFKAFYLDSLPKKSDMEVNATLQENGSVPVETAEPIKSEKIEENNRTEIGWQDKKGMPIDKLGDSIADSLKGKL